MKTDPKIIQNAVYVPWSDTYYLSHNTHDYIEFQVNAKGNRGMIDGGRSYFRCSVNNPGEVINFRLTEEDKFETVCDKLLWGTYGKDGVDPLKYLPIKTFTIEHLRAIAELPYSINPIHLNVVQYWLKEKLAKISVDKSNIRDLLNKLTPNP